MTNRLLHSLSPPLFITAVLLVLLFSCNPSESMQQELLEAQKQQWIAQMNETFSAYTQDTVELRRRLDHFTETGNKLGQAATYRILGVQARYASQFRKAIELHTAGLALAREIADTVNITILLNDLATNYRRIGAYNDALPYSFQALQTAERYRGPDTLSIQRNMASAYNGIGNIYLPMERMDEALEVFGKALELDSRQNNHWGIAVNLSNIGSIHFSRGEYELAEEYYRRSMEHNEQANQLVGTALGHINLGELFQAQERFDDALAEYTVAYDSLKHSTDQLHWLDACFHIADIHLRMNRPTRATPYLDEGLRKAREIHSLKHLSRVYQLYSTYNYGRGDYRRSVNDLRMVQAYNDTIRQNREAEQLLESRIQYESERYSRQIEELDRENIQHEARNRTMRLLLFPLLVILAGSLLLLSYKRRLENRQAAEVKKLERMRSNFFTNITHELRTPITVINGLAGHLRKTVKDATESETEDLDAICRQGENMMRLVNQLLDFSRSEAGVDKPRWRHGDIVEYLRALAEPYTQYARNKGVELVVYSEAESLTTNFAPSHLGKVMDNLLSNALKHTPEGGRIVVHLRHDTAARKCSIQVKDNGEGIAPENLPRIFELYYTSDADKGGVASSGIGLALTKQLVEDVGGTIAVTSTLGKGTEFTVSLPVSTAPIPPEQLSEPSATGYETKKVLPDVSETCSETKKVLSEPSDTCFEGKKPLSDVSETCSEGKKVLSDASDGDKPVVLIVEDNRDVAHYISTVLGGEYSLLYAANGVEGLAMAERHVPDLIITDVMMPEKDGYELTADLRASLATSHIPVIMLTAKATDGDRIEGIRTGADAYLTKPFNEEELVVRIEKLLESRAKLMEVYSGALLAGGFENTATGGTDGIADQDKDFTARLSVAIAGHLDDDTYFPEKLSRDMCLSTSQLNRKLKAMTGDTVSSFVMGIRLNKAKLLLSEGGRSIKEVAFACGFGDLGYFSRSFKKAFGCTPSQFAKTAGS
jgi:signal transduction histidine kinase/AraC-like DNA-binding protein/ActR/RegA family two-component response regulator